MKRIYLLLILCLAWVPSAYGVLSSSDLTYLGAFRVPTDTGSYWLGYGGFALEYNPTNNTLYTICKTVGSDSHKAVTEISIPTPVISTSVSGLNRAITVQGCVDITSGGLDAALSGEQLNRLRGLALYDSKLFYSFWSEYNPDDTDLVSVGYSSLNFSSPNSQGEWYADDAYVSKYYSGYLVTIPSDIAETYLSGKHLASGVTRQGGHFARGPALIAHNAHDYSDASPPAANRMNGTPLLMYTETEGQDNFPGYLNDTLEDWRDAVWLDDPDVTGIVFVGHRGLNYCWYGDISESGYTDDCYDWHGYHCDTFRSAIAIYDPADIIAVAQGTDDPWDPQPTEIVYMDTLIDGWFDSACTKPVGITYDAVGNRLFITQYQADSDYPVVHVFDVETGDDTTPPTLSSKTIPSAGTSISFVFNEAVTIGAGGNGGWTASMSGGAVTLAYASGSGSNTLIYNLSRTIYSGETGTVSYTQPGNGVEDASGNDLANISSSAVTNNSTQSSGTPSGSIVLRGGRCMGCN